MCDEEINIYEYLYDYDDLKIAVCVSDYLQNSEEEYTYEDVANITLKIKRNWECDKKCNELSNEEYSYIQSYAYKYMNRYYGG